MPLIVYRKPGYWLAKLCALHKTLVFTYVLHSFHARISELITFSAFASTTIYSPGREGDKEEGMVGGVHP